MKRVILEKNKIGAEGAILEAELLLDDEYPHYKDVIHPVQVLAYFPETQLYRCKLLAFPEEKKHCDWEFEELHEPRDYGEVNEADKNVHVRIRKRRAGNCWNVDGLLSEEGIWVKSKLLKKTKDGRYLVEHASWTMGGEPTKVRRVDPMDIRPGY
jgi:hypothetical protein